MVYQSSLRQWLSRRIQIGCIAAFIAGALLPPYVPSEALADTDEILEIDTPQFLLVEDGFLMKSSSLTQQGARRAYAEGIIHVVQAGETLEGLKARYGIRVATIQWANKLPPGVPIRPGQELIILPVDGVLHTVSRGQTLSRIAELYSVPASEIALQNSVQGDFILAGQELIIPGGQPILPPTQVAVTPQRPPQGKPPAGISPLPVKVTTAEPSHGVLQMPCNNCTYTQYYRAGHYAVDIQTRGGGPIFASEEGEIIRADFGWNGGYGNVVEVDHGNNLVTLYAHNKEIFVKIGDTVQRGQQIASMGNTGRVYGKTGIHVHFEVRVNGVKKNPLLYLK